MICQNICCEKALLGISLMLRVLDCKNNSRSSWVQTLRGLSTTVPTQDEAEMILYKISIWLLQYIEACNIMHDGSSQDRMWMKLWLLIWCSHGMTFWRPVIGWLSAWVGVFQADMFWVLTQESVRSEVSHLDFDQRYFYKQKNIFGLDSKSRKL